MDLGGLNMADMFGKVMEMQQKMSEAQQALETVTVEAEAGGGMVKVTANGAQRVLAIKIEPTVVNPDDMEMLEDLIIAGVNKALDEASRVAREEMQKTAGNFLPPRLRPESTRSIKYRAVSFFVFRSRHLVACDNTLSLDFPTLHAQPNTNEKQKCTTRPSRWKPWWSSSQSCRRLAGKQPNAWLPMCSRCQEKTWWRFRRRLWLSKIK